MREAQYALHAAIEDRHWWFAGRRAIVKRLLERVVPTSKDSSVPQAERATVIDVGCGTGANIAAFADDFRCVGIDSSERAIELARSRFPQIEFACEVELAPRAELFRGASAVLLMDVLEHVEDDFEFLSRVLALLEPGAHVLITVPAEAALWSQHDESFGHWRRYDFERLRATWRGLPVDERLVSAFNARLYPIIKSVRRLTRRRARSAGDAGTDFSLPPAFANRLLERVFAGESAALDRALDRGGAPAYSRGASLIAILRRGEGSIAARTKPANLAPDLFDPSAKAQ